jgi:nucleotide-binding universal stress UspA family protein
MFKKMLVLLDGSKLAEVVYSYAGELIGRLDMEVDFLNICRPEEADQLPMRQAYIEHMAETLIGKTGIKTVRVRGRVVVGYPPEEILKYAGENQIDLIMLATHGVSGIRRWGLGSVADKIIHETDIPVWLVPSQLSELILTDSSQQRSILIPLDGSKLAETIIPRVKELVKQRGVETELIMVNVVTLPVIPYNEWGGKAQTLGENLSALKVESAAYLDGLVKTLQEDGFTARTEQLTGDPTEEIVKYAAEYKPRLIAMTTHGRSGLNRFIFGSVAENVLRRLKRTPLFLVRPKE